MKPTITTTTNQPIGKIGKSDLSCCCCCCKATITKHMCIKLDFNDTDNLTMNNGQWYETQITCYDLWFMSSIRLVFILYSSCTTYDVFDLVRNQKFLTHRTLIDISHVNNILAQQWMDNILYVLAYSFSLFSFSKIRAHAIEKSLLFSLII